MPPHRTQRLGQAKPLELLHSGQHGRPDIPLDRRIHSGPQVDNPLMARGLAGEHAVEPGPPVSIDLGIEPVAYLDIAARSELEGGQVLGASPQALADVVAGNDQIPAVLTLAAHHDMNVRIVSVPVVDADPVKLAAEIPLRLCHQAPCKCPQIGKPPSVLRRHDEPKMMPVAIATFGESTVVGILVLCVEHPAGGTVPRNALPAQICQMRFERSSFHTVANHPGFDGHAARLAGHRARSDDAGGPATAKTGALRAWFGTSA